MILFTCIISMFSPLSVPEVLIFLSFHFSCRDRIMTDYLAANHMVASSIPGTSTILKVDKVCVLY